MIVISAEHYNPPLASGSHEYLFKLVSSKRDSGHWRYPVAIVPDGIKLITDHEYYHGMNKPEGPSLEERLQMVKQALKAGFTSLPDISKATGLSRGQIRYIDRVFAPRDQSYWLAEPYDDDGKPIRTDSVRTMSSLLGIPARTVKQVAERGGMAMGYRITKKAK
ncbi:hypothetical protein [Lactiplantibacillus paraxiangfangensis]|uniref:hypothetical protein n=1 Tax=Lactiplantibacillus paraxiangfangensis TaxID=3076224 RepID=UPI0030C6A9C8